MSFKETFNKFKGDFVAGIALILPVLLTLTIVRWLLQKINFWILEPVMRVFRPFIYDSTVFIALLKLCLFFALVIALAFIGSFTKVIFVRRLLSWGEGFLKRMPVVNKIYSATKEISSAIFGQKKGLFKRVVLIEYPRKGLLAIAFVTSENVNKGLVKKELGDDMVSVFVPTSPTPMTGYFLFMPKNELIDVNFTVEEAIKLILSGGAILPPDRQLA